MLSCGAPVMDTKRKLFNKEKYVVVKELEDVTLSDILGLPPVRDYIIRH